MKSRGRIAAVMLVLIVGGLVVVNEASKAADQIIATAFY